MSAEAPDHLLTRASAWSAQHRWALDASIVGAIVVAGTLRAPDSIHDLTAWLFTLALALPLLWRRRAPVAVFAAISALALVQWAVDVKAFGDAALLVALYTIAATQPFRRTLAAVAILEVGVAIAIARWAPDGHPLDGFVALSGLALAAMLLGINVRHRQALLEGLRERADRLEAERDQQGRLAAAAERARIAREMHDVVAHNLSVMIALADGADYALADDPERARIAVRSISRTGRQALTEMRRLLGVLRDGDATDGRTPQPGVAQLDALIEQVRTAGVPTTITVAGVPPERVSDGLQLATYRIVQEALTNVMKHAGPDVEATVTLRWDGPRLDLAVTNSAGALPPDAEAREGGGLRGMRERASVYDGTIAAGPAPGGGWTVRAELTESALTTA